MLLRRNFHPKFLPCCLRAFASTPGAIFGGDGRIGGVLKQAVAKAALGRLSWPLGVTGDDEADAATWQAIVVRRMDEGPGLTPLCKTNNRFPMLSLELEVFCAVRPSSESAGDACGQNQQQRFIPRIGRRVSAYCCVPSAPLLCVNIGCTHMLVCRHDALDLSAFPGAQSTDPFSAVSDQLAGLNASIKSILGVDHPVLEKVAAYFFDVEGGGGKGACRDRLLPLLMLLLLLSLALCPQASIAARDLLSAGKKLRPAMVLLVADALNAHMAAAYPAGVVPPTTTAPTTYLTDGLPPGWAAHVALDDATGAPSDIAAVSATQAAPAPSTQQQLHLTPVLALPLQRRLAEVTEMIHTASLLHDDVVDGSDMRRGVPSASAVFGNKLAVLAGDFMLARSSVCLARLRRCVRGVEC
jgi:geranylgeranyl pyrophosphate synthase